MDEDKVLRGFEDINTQLAMMRREMREVRLLGRRERIAERVMAGVAASGSKSMFESIAEDGRNTFTEAPKYAAEIAVAWADALISELDK